jgi:hypothetical protein
MFDSIFEALFSILDITGTHAGPESKSIFIRILGIIVWAMLLIGIVLLIIF